MPAKFLGGLILLALAIWPARPVSGQERPTLLDALWQDERPYSARRSASPPSGNRYGIIHERAWNAETTVVDEPQFGPRLSVRGIFGDRRGVEGNDYSVAAFLPWHLVPNEHVLFVVLRGTASDAGARRGSQSDAWSIGPAGSFGIGERFYLPEANRVVGVSLWCDVDDAHRQTYFRAGGHLEVIGPHLEFRGGTDVVLGNNQWLDPHAVQATPLFAGHDIHIRYSNQAERAFDQAYVELGGPLPRVGRLGVNVYGGAYYLWHAETDGGVGWQARTSLAVADNVQLGARLTHDEPFGLGASAYVSLAVPAGGLREAFRAPRVIVRGQSIDESSEAREAEWIVRRLAGEVARSFRIPVQFGVTAESVTAIDPDSGQEYAVIHVDPNAATEGDGSFERPFKTLEAARLANDDLAQIIRVVAPAEGAADNLVLSAPFRLFANQRLLSSSVPHLVATEEGTFSLPGFTGGYLPVVTNSMQQASAVVRMADRTEVSGFRIDGEGRHVGLQGNIEGFNINRNTVVNATHGVNMANARGTAVIDQNAFLNNIGDGINVTVTDRGPLELIVSGNTGEGNGDDALDVTVTGSSLSATFEANTFGGSGDHGLELTSRSDSTIFADVLRNHLGEAAGGIGGNAGAGLRYDADSGFASLTIGGADPDDGNTVLGNAAEGLSFHLTGTAVAVVDERNNAVPPLGDVSNSFNIVVEYAGGLTGAQRDAFAAAEQRWESIIIGDLANVGSIDDVHIVASAEAIDGMGGTLGEARPTGLRAGSYLPFHGRMRFDTADLAALQASGELEDVILHEMAHVLGFGSIWDQLGLVSGSGTSEPRFIGPQATAQFNAEFGQSAAGVPLETTGGEGTVEAHWLESVFGDELMTGNISGFFRPISRTTIAQFSDLGYLTDISQADP